MFYISTEDDNFENLFNFSSIIDDRGCLDPPDAVHALEIKQCIMELLQFVFDNLYRIFVAYVTRLDLPVALNSYLLFLSVTSLIVSRMFLRNGCLGYIRY